MFDWHNWIVELVIAIFFISGFVVFYNTLDSWLTHKFINRARGKQYTRIGLTCFAYVMAAFCLLAENWNPINSDAYMNWALYVLFVPVLDRDVSRLENVVRFGGILIFWTVNNNLAAPIYWVSLIALEAIMVVTNLFPHVLDRSRVLTVGLSMWIAIAFWLTQTQLMWMNIVMGVVMFAFMELFTVLYWSSERREQREREALVEQVNRDTLTGAGSFFAFKDDSMRLMVRAQEKREPLTLAMFDIDHFKRVNDKYGHAAGNFVLKQVTQLVDAKMHGQMGAACGLFRTGGEEFNMIFVNATVGDVKQLGADILDLIRAQEFEYEGQQLHVTLSMGITALTDHDMSFEDVYERADGLLYQSKQAGRDYVTVDA